MTEVAAPPLVEAHDVSVGFDLGRASLWSGGRRTLSAVDRVSLAVGRGETLGLIGESGSGKTTLGRCLLGIYKPSAGRVLFDGDDIASFRPPERHRFHRRAQLVFQDPYAALNPRMTVRGSLAEHRHMWFLCA